MTLQTGDTIIHKHTRRVGVVLSSGKAYTFVRWNSNTRKKRTQVLTEKLKRIG